MNPNKQVYVANCNISQNRLKDNFRGNMKGHFTLNKGTKKIL